MTAVPKNIVNKMIEHMHQPPLTDNFEKINFKNMNIFSKIQALPNHKNKKLTEHVRTIVRNKDKIDPQYFLINPKLIQKTKEDIDKDFFISNYRFKSQNRNKKLNNALFELNMKRNDQKLELVEEDYKENETDIYSSPKRRDFTPMTHKLLSNTGFYGYDDEDDDTDPLEKRVLPHSNITSGDIIKNCSVALEALNLDETIESNFRIKRHVQEGQRLTIKNYYRRVKQNPYLTKFQRKKVDPEDEYYEKRTGVLDIAALKHLRCKDRVKERDEAYLINPSVNQSYTDPRNRRAQSSHGYHGGNRSFNIRGGGKPNKFGMSSR